MTKKSKKTTDEIIDEISTYHSDNKLREDGWMTVDDFIKTLVPGLQEYLERNWGFRGKDDLHHPVDLFTNASIYMDIACHVAQDFINCRHVKEH